MRIASLVVAFGCSTSAPKVTPVGNATEGRDGPCDLVEAMLRIDNEHYQTFFNGKCTSTRIAKPMFVDVRAASLVPADTKCDGRAFRLYRAEPIDDLILRLTLRPVGKAWHFTATMFQPVPKPNPEGGFDSTDSYCAVAGGYVELRDGVWHTSYDINRATRPR
jgi:hypothetical protein